MLFFCLIVGHAPLILRRLGVRLCSGRFLSILTPKSWSPRISMKNLIRSPNHSNRVRLKQENPSPPRQAAAEVSAQHFWPPSCVFPGLLGVKPHTESARDWRGGSSLCSALVWDSSLSISICLEAPSSNFLLVSLSGFYVLLES